MEESALTRNPHQSTQRRQVIQPYYLRYVVNAFPCTVLPPAGGFQLARTWFDVKRGFYYTQTLTARQVLEGQWEILFVTAPEQPLPRGYQWHHFHLPQTLTMQPFLELRALECYSGRGVTLSPLEGLHALTEKEMFGEDDRLIQNVLESDTAAGQVMMTLLGRSSTKKWVANDQEKKDRWGPYRPYLKESLNPHQRDCLHSLRDKDCLGDPLCEYNLMAKENETLNLIPHGPFSNLNACLIISEGQCSRFPYWHPRANRRMAKKLVERKDKISSSSNALSKSPLQKLAALSLRNKRKLPLEEQPKQTPVKYAKIAS